MRAKEGNHINWGEIITAENIYHSESTKSLMKVYIWLVEKEETHMPVSSILSKQILQKKIKALQQHFIKNQKAKKAKEDFNDISMDPNYLYTLKMSKIGSPYLAKMPKNHAIGDQVICLTPEFFGHSGVIVGINNRKYQVLFEQPSFGKNDLGGLC